MGNKLQKTKRKKDTLPCWINLGSFSSKPSTALNSSPTILNPNEFIAPLSMSFPFYYKYNIEKKLWTDYGNHHINTSILYRNIDKKTHQVKTIYATAKDSKTHLTIIDAKTNKSKTFDLGHIINENSYFVIHKDTLHIIGGDTAYKHYTADINGNNIQLKHTFDFSNARRNYNRSAWGINFKFEGFVYLESNQQFYAFGVQTDYDIWQYNICTNKWNKLNIRTPFEVWSVAVVSSLNERYILFFGGLQSWHAGGDYVKTNKIYIWDLVTMEFKRSKVVCPRETGSYRAIVMRSIKEKIVVYGYLRKMDMGVKEMCEQILEYYQDDYIHLLDHSGGNSIEQHCITLSQLFQNTKAMYPL